jgi:hypothetical protein
MLCVAVAASGLAQAPQAPQASQASLIGIVRDTAGAPVANTRLTTAGLLTISDSAGRFNFGVVPSGAMTLLVRRLGFEPLDVSLRVIEGLTNSIDVVITVLPQDLPGMTTFASADMRGRLSDFYRHRQSGIGTFLDRQEIEARRAQRITDILRRLPGTRVAPERSGRSAVRMNRSYGGRDCPPDVWIDGVRAAGLNVDDIPIGDVEALELYRGPAGLPPEMNSRLGNPACGALVIWTRVPG